MSDIVERLRERTTLRYMADCKCGNCQCVPHPVVTEAFNAIAILRAEKAELLAVLKAYERWEADIIESNEAWGPPDEMREFPHFTENLWDRMLELQEMRNTAISKAEEMGK